jgi:hypothetical protein
LQPQPARISPQSERRATEGSFELPRSIVENLSLLPHAELCMVLIIHRGPFNQEISDSHWQKWTGLKPRIKQLAIKGLKQKGLTVHGQGQKARYYFDSDIWQTWVRSQRPEAKAKIEAKSPKPGQKIHPDCAKNGCQRLCEAKCDDLSAHTAQKVVAISEAPPPQEPYVEPPETAQYIAQNPPNSLILGLKRQTQGEDRIYGTKGEEFTALIGQFMNLGVKLSKADIQRCRKLWTPLTAEEKTTALAYALARAADDWKDRELRYIPRPWNYLERKDWERRGPERKEPEKWNPFT